MRTLGTNTLKLYQDERCLHVPQRFLSNSMKLGIASKAKQKSADNKLFIKALASLRLKKSVKISRLTQPQKNNYRAKRMLLAFVIRGQIIINNILHGLQKIYISNHFILQHFILWVLSLLNMFVEIVLDTFAYFPPMNNMSYLQIYLFKSENISWNLVMNFRRQ